MELLPAIRYTTIWCYDVMMMAIIH